MLEKVGRMAQQVQKLGVEMEGLRNKNGRDEKQKGSLCFFFFERFTELSGLLEKLRMEVAAIGKLHALEKGEQKASVQVTTQDSRTFSQE